MDSSSIFRNCLIAIALIATCAVSSADAEETLRLNFGVYSSNKPSAMVKVLRPVLKKLESKMSERLEREVDIRMQIAKNYEQGISDLVNGQVDFSHFGPASYVEAKRINDGIEIIAVEKLNDSKVSYGIIAVHKDSDIRDIGDLRGRSFAFGDEGSTIGRFLSQLELVQADILGVDLSRYEYLGRHDKVGTAVAAKAFDAGALSEQTFNELVESGEPIRELVRFPNVSAAWIARAGLDEDILTALQESLLSVAEPTVNAALRIDGFLEGSDPDYAGIRLAMENNDTFFQEREDAPGAKPSHELTSLATDEPAIRAAVANQQSDTSASDPAARTHKIAAEGTTVTTPDSESSNITVNIEIPASLFSQGRYTGPDSLIINLKMPAMNE